MATQATAGEPKRELVWVRGPGLNAPGAENRAREIAGEGWRNAIIRGTVMRVMRNGRKHVKLALGPSLWIEPRYLTTEPNEAEPHSEYVSVREEGEHELGSDAEEEDLPGEDGEVEGAQSVRVIRGDRDWTRRMQRRRFQTWAKGSTCSSGFDIGSTPATSNSRKHGNQVLC